MHCTLPRFHNFLRVFRLVAAVGGILMLIGPLISITAVAQQSAVPAAQDKPYVVEYYYKAKWGYADEFLTLFKKNHYPLLKRQAAAGDSGQAPLPRRRGGALGLPGDDRLPGRGGGVRRLG